MAEISLFKDIRPTWDIVGFDENVPDIPLRIQRFSAQKPPESAVYALVIGDSLVYRIFELDCRVEVTDGYLRLIAMLPSKETERYVFGSGGMYLEKPDRTRALTAPGKIPDEDIYEALLHMDSWERRNLFRDFLHKVNIAHKEDIIQAFNHVKEYPQFGFRPFIEIYSKAIEDGEIGEDVPERIVNELNNRTHPCDKAIRIDKDLVVITGSQKCRYLDCVEQTRAYFDNIGAYYFKQNAVTHRWQPDDSWKNEIKEDYFRPVRVIDKDLFDNTCVEDLAEYSVEKRIPSGSMINLSYLLAQFGFLSAEQAAKMESPVFDVILKNICSGRLTDGTQSLSELLGISGAQIKFLNDIEIPEDLEGFAKYIDDEDFKRYFPDIKKRIFAVSFYLNYGNRDHPEMGVKKEEVFEVAQTLNSLENTESERRDFLTMEYSDYIRMLRVYRFYVNHTPEDDPLKAEICAYGEFRINMKPSKIWDCHNKLGRLISIIKGADQIRLYTAAISERKQKEAKEIEYSDGTFSIIMPKDANEIIREGRELSHCVGSAGYIGRMAKGDCRILFLRKNDDIARPLITIEERDGSIKQCYGFCDSYNKDPKIRDFINDYAIRRKLCIECVIYSE